MAFASKSPWVIHYDGSSCNGCDIEVLATLCPGFDGERFGVVNTGMRVRLHFGADCGARVSANPGGGVRVRLELRRLAI